MDEATFEGAQHYGWAVSPYTAKTRAALMFKGVDFDDVEASAPRLFLQIKRAVGHVVMPTVLRTDGSWLQDSSDIIDALERAHPNPPITPPGPKQRIASLLLELHGDEWLTLPAMHYRWTIPENRQFARTEFARSGAPFVPRFIGRRLTAPIADKMASYLPLIGVTKETAPGIERFVGELVAALEAHLATTPFLLGSRPCLGDFALFGPLWAHLFRDPGSRHLFDDAPAVRAWFGHLERPSGQPGEFLADDEVPATLDPIFRTLFAEQWPYLEALVAAIDAYCAEHPEAARVPRALGDTAFTIGGSPGTRRLITFGQWMLQRPLRAYADCAPAEREAVDAWLERVGARGELALEVRNPLVRRDFAMRLEKHPRD